jgi:phage-related tail fiber protein
MAQTINSGSLFGSGALINQDLTSGTTYTFTLVNNVQSIRPSAPGGYLTVYGSQFANNNINTQPGYIVEGALSTFEHTMAAASGSTKIIQNSRGFSVTIPNAVASGSASGSFAFQPSTTITANTVYVQCVGNYDLTITP